MKFGKKLNSQNFKILDLIWGDNFRNFINQFFKNKNRDDRTESRLYYAMYGMAGDILYHKTAKRKEKRKEQKSK